MSMTIIMSKAFTTDGREVDHYSQLIFNPELPGGNPCRDYWTPEQFEAGFEKCKRQFGEPTIDAENDGEYDTVWYFWTVN